MPVFSCAIRCCGKNDAAIITATRHKNEMAHVLHDTTIAVGGRDSSSRHSIEVIYIVRKQDTATQTTSVAQSLVKGGSDMMQEYNSHYEFDDMSDLSLGSLRDVEHKSSEDCRIVRKTSRYSSMTCNDDDEYSA